MRLYHASSVIVEYPDTIHSREYLDFGREIATTLLPSAGHVHPHKLRNLPAPYSLFMQSVFYAVKRTPG